MSLNLFSHARIHTYTASLLSDRDIWISLTLLKVLFHVLYTCCAYLLYSVMVCLCREFAAGLPFMRGHTHLLRYSNHSCIVTFSYTFCE